MYIIQINGIELNHLMISADAQQASLPKEPNSSSQQAEKWLLRGLFGLPIILLNNETVCHSPKSRMN